MMSFSWQLLNANVQLPASNCKTQVNIFPRDEYAIIVATLMNKTSISILNLSNWSVYNTSQLLPLGDPSWKIIEASQRVYVICEDGSLYRLLTSSEDFRENKYYWMKLNEAKKLKAATGLQYGLAAIEEINNCVYLNIYDLNKQLIPKISISIGTSSGEYFITSFPKEKWNKELCQAVFAERAQAIFDTILFINPAGMAYLYPLISENQGAQPVLIYTERDKLPKCVFLSDDGKAITFVYDVGKIVFIFFDETKKKIRYKVFYLTSSVMDAIIRGASSNITVIWTDCISLNIASIQNYELTHKANSNNLPGVRSLFLINEEILAHTVHDAFYKIIIDSDFSSVRNPTKILSDLNKIGIKVEDLKKKLDKVDSWLYAMQSEQDNSEQFTLSLVENKVLLENAGSRTLRNDLWSVVVESSCQQDISTKVYPLGKDLNPGECEEFDVSDFIANGCTHLKVCLKGDVGHNYRCLKLSVGTVTVTGNTLNNVRVYISEKLNEILIKRKGS